MSFALTLLAFLQLSRALHIGLGVRKVESTEVRRALQDSASNDFTGSLATGVADTQKPKKPIPWWKLPNTDNGEMNALTGQQLYPFDNDDDEDGDSGESTTDSTEDSVCPLGQCDSSGLLGKTDCGPHARCINSYCQCNLGWKPASSLHMARGWSGLEALTVWTDTTYMGCAERCDTLSCSEVPQVKSCFGSPATEKDDNNGSNGNNEQLATDGLNLGAIKAPGADAGLDFSGGVAVTGGAGQAT